MPPEIRDRSGPAPVIIETNTLEQPIEFGCFPQAAHRGLEQRSGHTILIAARRGKAGPFAFTEIIAVEKRERLVWST